VYFREKVTPWGRGHRLNMELDLQSLFGLHVPSCTYWPRPRNPPPPHLGSLYEGVIGQAQDGRHLFVTPWTGCFRCCMRLGEYRTVCIFYTAITVWKPGRYGKGVLYWKGVLYGTIKKRRFVM
jgi:hypothetical protein